MDLVLFQDLSLLSYFKHFYNDIYDTYEKSELDQAFWEQNISLLLKFPLKPTTA